MSQLRLNDTSLVDVKIDIPVATLPCDWLYRIGAGTGWSGVSIL